MTRFARPGLIAATWLLALAPSAVTAQSATGGKIQVVGRATIDVVPDMVSVMVGISKRAPTAAAAVDQSSAAARKVVDFSKKFGIPEQDLQTIAVNLAPMYKNVREPDGTNRQELDGYVASNSIRVRLREIARIGDYLRDVLDQGATNIAAIQFGLSNSEAAADEARAKAVEDAIQRAQRLAAAAKIKLGPILELVHPPRSARVPASSFEPAARAAVAVPVEAGTLRVGAEVEITWSIE
jgi:uncharacterized protein